MSYLLMVMGGILIVGNEGAWPLIGFGLVGAGYWVFVTFEDTGR